MRQPGEELQQCAFLSKAQIELVIEVIKANMYSSDKKSK